MSVQSPAYKNYLKNRQNAFDSEKLQEIRKDSLYNEKTFYGAFIKDMLNAEKEVIIYSPFVSKFRSEFFSDTLKKLRRRNIPVFIFTRPLEEHDYFMRAEISCALKDYEELGACVCNLSGSIHEKVAIIDRKVLWEGSLNILSQRQSREMMRRVSDEDLAMQMMTYLGLNIRLVEGYKLQYERLYRNLVNNTREDRKIKIRLFFTGVLVPAIVWCLATGLKVITLSLKGVKVLMDLVNLILGVK